MTYSIDFKPVVRLLLSILLIGAIFSTIHNTKYSIPIRYYTSPADTLIAPVRVSFEKHK